jgi:hypothetical protein
MFHTTYGLLLITATVEVLDGQLLYDSLVRPEKYITDLTPWFQESLNVYVYDAMKS